MAEYDYKQRPATKDYRDNYDDIDWGKKPKEPKEEDSEMDRETIHVYPVGDLRKHHTDSTECWCKPTPDEEYPNLLIHHSMDRREEYEEGRKVS